MKTLVITVFAGLVVGVIVIVLLMCRSANQEEDEGDEMGIDWDTDDSIDWQAVAP